MIGQEAGHGQAITTVGLHAQGERLQPAQRQKTIHRPWNGANGILQEFQLLV